MGEYALWTPTMTLSSCRRSIYLARAYRAARDSETALLNAWRKESHKLIQEQTHASTEQAQTNEAVAAALDRLSERLDR